MDGSTISRANAETADEANAMLTSLVSELAHNSDAISVLSKILFQVDVRDLSPVQFERYTYLTSQHKGILSEAANAAILEEVFRNSHPLNDTERKEYNQFMASGKK